MQDNQISSADLQRVVLDAVSTTPGNSWQTIRESVLKRVSADNLGSLGRHAKQTVNQAIIELILEGLVTPGSKDGMYEPNWPAIILTDLGRDLLSAQGAHCYDPSGFVDFTVSEAPRISERTKEYLLEGVKCFRHGLLFASAIMIGAAAELETLRLVKAIARWESDSATEKKLRADLERGRLPSLFGHIRSAVDRATKKHDMPYEIHEGSLEHLLSFQEMVRALRNSAVHAGARGPAKAKVLLCLSTFPTALGSLDRLRIWFESKSTGKGSE